MNNEEKATELSEKLYSGRKDYIGKRDLFSYLMSMATWKDEQLKQTREDAKGLHDEISDCIGSLVKSRLSKNGIGESNALQQMESIMVKTQQFLQTI